MATTKTNLRMLFLHGQFLPPECYKEKLAKIFFSLGAEAGWDIETVQSPRITSDEAPSIVKTLFPDLTVHPEWINSENHNDDDDYGTKTYHGLQESLDFLQTYIKEQPRFDVIAGHSNGAVMTSLLTLYMEAKPDFVPANKHPKSILLMNGPASYETERTLRRHLVGLPPPFVVSLPSVHVFGGPTDMTWEGQQQLQKIHHPQGAIIIQHDHGHMFPESEPQIYQQIFTTLEEQIAGHSSK